MGREIKDEGITDAGRRILAVLDAREWTLTEFSKRCGRGPHWGSRLIRAESIPYADAVIVGRVLSVSPGSLFRDERAEP